MIPALSNPALASHAPSVADVAARPAAERARASAPLVSPLVIEKLAPEVGGPRATGLAGTKTTSGTSSAGWAQTASAKKTPDPLAFLKDKKLSVDQKLMRLLAHLNAQYEAEMNERMKALGGDGDPATSKKTSSPSATSKPKKKGWLSSLAGAVSSFFPAVGIATSVLKTKSVQTLLGKIGGPVLAAAASAMGFPALAPALLKLGPSIVNVMVDGAKAFDAAVLEDRAKASSGGAASLAAAASTASSSSASSTSASSSTSKLSASEQQLQLMEIQQLRDKQSEMFKLVSNILKAGHDTRSAIIGNIR